MPHRSIGHHERGLGVPAAHHAAVGAEELDVPALVQGRLGQDLRGQLDALAPDAGQQHLALHVALHGRRAASDERSSDPRTLFCKP